MPSLKPSSFIHLKPAASIARSYVCIYGGIPHYFAFDKFSDSVHVFSFVWRKMILKFMCWVINSVCVTPEVGKSLRRGDKIGRSVTPEALKRRCGGDKTGRDITPEALKKLKKGRQNRERHHPRGGKKLKKGRQNVTSPSKRGNGYKGGCGSVVVNFIILKRQYCYCKVQEVCLQ